MDMVLNNYNSVTEKVIKEQVTIAYETETKDLSQEMDLKRKRLFKMV